MAQRTTVKVELVDDIDGGKAERTIQFGLDGEEYEIELSRKNGRALSKVMEKYIAAARKKPRTPRKNRTVKTARSPRRERPVAAPEASARDIRAWARENDYVVPAKGRIPAPVREAYAEAHGK